MIDERPVLLITFNTQQITVIRDAMGTIIEGKEVLFFFFFFLSFL